MVISQHGQIFNPWKQQLLLGSLFSLPKSSLTFYKLSSREEEYLRLDHVMVIVTIHPELFSLSMSRLKPRSCHSDQQTTTPWPNPTGLPVGLLPG